MVRCFVGGRRLELLVLDLWRFVFGLGCYVVVILR